MHPIDLAHNALHAVGWSAGDCSIAILGRPAWVVTCAGRGHFVLVTASTQAQAWEEAVRPGEALASR
jgi:hypothetical protein